MFVAVGVGVCVLGVGCWVVVRASCNDVPRERADGELTEKVVCLGLVEAVCDPNQICGDGSAVDKAIC